MDKREETEQHIIQGVLQLFLQRGMKRTSVDDIAHAAGLTRATIYRYFPQREQIVRAAFRRLVLPFQNARDWVETDPTVAIEPVLDSIARDLTHLPHGDLPSCLDELRRGYPSIYDEFTHTRRAALRVIFDHLFSVVEQQERLRPGLNRRVVEAYFMEAVINVLENPTLLEQEVSPAELYTTVKTVFLYGVLKAKEP